ncbi:MAG: hypothetical protein O7D94_02295 [Planctomycetota bacterium]|nr:hypothetical protein [Planctomycetota bacterium]
MAQWRNDLDKQQDLVGYHLGLIGPDGRARVEEAFESRESLEAACASLQSLLAPLDADTADLPPKDLTQGILDRVEKAGSVIPFVPAAAASEVTATERGGAGGSFIAPRELVGLAAAILIFVGIFVPGYYTARGSARKAICASNLRELGNGYAGYAETNGSQWPFAGLVPAGTPWARADSRDQFYARNSRHVYPLVRGGFVPAAAFICPGRPGDIVFQFGDPDAYNDFPDARNNSYATNFVAGPWHQQMFLPSMPIAAGMTPLVDQDRRLIRGRPVSANSPNHGRGGGQNVLHANLSVRFYRSPILGRDNDDIYRLKGVLQYTGIERPQSRNDAFLIP